MHDRQAGLVRGGPDRVKVRVVDGNVEGQAYEDSLGPGGVGVPLDLDDGALDVPRGSKDERVKTAGVAAAHVVQVAMDALDHGHIDSGILMPRRRAGDHEVDVDAFLVHVADTRVGVPVGAPQGWNLEALEVLEVTLRVGAGSGLSEVPGRVRTPTSPFGDAVVMRIGLGHLLAGPARLELADLQLFLHVTEQRSEIGIEALRRRVEVRVRVENLLSVAHRILPLAVRRSCPAEATRSPVLQGKANLVVEYRPWRTGRYDNSRLRNRGSLPTLSGRPLSNSPPQTAGERTRQLPQTGGG